MNNMMKKVICITAALAATVAIVLVATHFFGKNDEATDRFEHEIYFPISGEMINPDLVTTNNLDKSKVENEEILGTYYVVKEEISDSRKEHIIEAFGMENADVNTNEGDGITIWTYKKGDEQLIIYSNGTYHYKKNVNKDETQMKSVEIEDSVLIEKAEKYLKDNDLIPGDFAYSKMGETTLEDVTITENASTAEDISIGDKKVITKDLYFNRQINGIDVEGTSKIVVYMNADGEVDEIYSSYREIEETVEVKENYSVDEMVNRLKKLYGTLYINPDADEITLDSVEVIYYEDSAPNSDNATIQPIYRVRGSSLKDGEEIDEYFGLTSAVKR